MLLSINCDILLVGDLHGHILDLFRIFREFGFPPNTRYLFLGDLVDRGEFSTETTVLILTLKILWPSVVWLIRGNHEFCDMWLSGGFNKELDLLYPNKNAADVFASTFAWIPIGAIVNKRSLCLHGGISPSFSKLSEISGVERPLDSFEEDPCLDILWSDPSDDIDMFQPWPRGTGHRYGSAALSVNEMDLLVRGHECADRGFLYKLNDQVVTVFSASAYCNMRNNKAVVMIFWKNGMASSPCTFPPIRYILRGSAVFLTSDNEVRFTIDHRKVHTQPFLPSQLPSLVVRDSNARSGEQLPPPQATEKAQALPRISTFEELIKAPKRQSVGYHVLDWLITGLRHRVDSGRIRASFFSGRIPRSPDDPVGKHRVSLLPRPC
jgi:hypothetical protein